MNRLMSFFLFFYTGLLFAQLPYDSCKSYFNKTDYVHAKICLESVKDLIKNTDTLHTLEYQYLYGVSLMNSGVVQNGIQQLNQVNSISATYKAKNYAYWQYASAIQLGNYYFQAKDYSKAENYYTTILKLYPFVNDNNYKLDFIVLSNNLANIYYQSGQYSKAIPQYNKVLELKKKTYGDQSPEQVKTYNQLALCSRALNNFSDALTFYSSSDKILQNASLPESKEMCDTRIGQGICFYQLSDYINALTVFRNAYDLSAKNQQRNNYLLSSYYLSSIYLKNGDDEKANQYTQEGLKQLNSNTKDEFYPYFCSRSADYQLASSNYSEAESVINNGLNFYQNDNKNEIYWKLLSSKADLFRKTGRLNEADQLYTDIEKQIQQNTGLASVYSTVLNNHALLYDEEGLYTKAEQYYQKDIDLSKTLFGEQSLSYATSVMNLADLYKETGSYDKSEKGINNALSILKNSKGETSIEYAQALNNLASLQELLGRNTDAKITYKRVLSIYETSNNTQSLEYAFALSNYGSTLELTGDYQEALKVYQKSLIILESQVGKNNPAYGSVLNNMALLSIKSKNYTEAEKYLKQDIEIVKGSYGEKHPSYATAISNLAEVYEAQEKYSDAEDLYKKALSIRVQSFGELHPDIAPLYANLARVKQSQKDFPNAKAYWEKSLDLYQAYISIYFPAMSEKERKQFYDGIHTRIEQFYSFAEENALVDTELSGWVYNLQINTKALLFNSSARVRDIILGSSNKDLMQKYSNWRNQKEQLSKLYTVSNSQIKDRQKLIDSLLTKVNLLEKELTHLSADFKESVNASGDWKSIQKKLSETDASLEIVRYIQFKPEKGGYYTDSIHYMYIVVKGTSQAPEVKIIKNGKSLESKFLSYYKNSIQFELSEGNSYKQYWSLIKPMMEQKIKIYISPDGVYNQINLNTLFDPDQQKYLLDEYDLVYITNSREIKNVYAVSSSQRIALFGAPDFSSFNYDAVVLNPLPGTLTEVEEIASIMSKHSWKVSLYSGPNANERNLKLCESYRIIHIATHGFFDPDKDSIGADNDPLYSFNENPLFKSGFYLSPSVKSKWRLLKKSYISNAEDGIVTAYEISNMNFSGVELVVLSACETGLGLIQNGEGVYGLQRAIRSAGSQSVLFSLWKVNDQSTKELMDEFYNQLILTNNKRIALKNAQQIIRKKYSSPYYWGAFMLNGE